MFKYIEEKKILVNTTKIISIEAITREGNPNLVYFTLEGGHSFQFTVEDPAAWIINFHNNRLK
jgi:hypothetical protein